MAIVEVKLHGALYNGTIVNFVESFIVEAEEAIAAVGVSEVRQILDAKIKNPTPYYETQVMTERIQDDSLVHDRDIVYGPWLEGVSSRNKSSRFKGYHAFRNGCQRMQARAQGIANQILKDRLSR